MQVGYTLWFGLLCFLYHPRPAALGGVNRIETCIPVPYTNSCVSLCHFRHGHGDVSIIRYLVESCGCNVNDIDDDGNTPLHFACQ